MKLAIILGDGMADWPLDELGGKTPLDAANHPYMDRLARDGEFGLVKTVPDGMSPGSDTANLSVFGYDPRRYIPDALRWRRIASAFRLPKRT